MLTHDPKLDDAALHAALASDALTSAPWEPQRPGRAAAPPGGRIDEVDLERIAAPVGLDLGAVTAQETALSIMAEIVALRRGREGGRLVDSRQRIHMRRRLVKPLVDGHGRTIGDVRVSALSEVPPRRRHAPRFSWYRSI